MGSVMWKMYLIVVEMVAKCCINAAASVERSEETGGGCKDGVMVVYLRRAAQSGLQRQRHGWPVHTARSWFPSP